MTTTKKGSSAKPRNRPPTQTPNINRNRFDKFTDVTEDQKPSYSEVASSNRISDFADPDRSQVPPPDENKEPKDTKFDAILTAIQSTNTAIKSINDRMDTTDSTVQNQFWAMNARFANMENIQDQATKSGDTDDDESLSRHNATNIPPNTSVINSDNHHHNNTRDRFQPPQSAGNNDNDYNATENIDSNVNRATNLPNHRRGNYRNHNNRPDSSDTQQSFLNQNQFTLAISNNIK